MRDVLLHAVDSGYAGQAWHGPTLSGSFHRVPVETAIWRPARDRKCIAEIVLHAAYWKYTVRRRLTDAPRGSFALKGSNWFALPKPFDNAAWKDARALLRTEHNLLRETVESFPLRRLGDVPKGSKFCCRDLILGVANHDIYHAGQIRTLRSLAP